MTPGSTATTARAWCDYVCKRGAELNHPNPAYHIAKMKRIEMAGLSEKYKAVFEGVLARLEAAPRLGEKLSARSAAIEAGFDENDWTNTLYKVRTLGLKDMLRRYEDVAGLTRAYGRQAKKAQEVPVSANQASDLDTARTSGNLVALVLAEMDKHGILEEAACHNLEIDYGEYLAAKEFACSNVSAAFATSPRLPAKALSFERFVPEPAAGPPPAPPKSFVDQCKIVPKPIAFRDAPPGPQDVLNQIIDLVKGLGEADQVKVLAAASAFFR